MAVVVKGIDKVINHLSKIESKVYIALDKTVNSLLATGLKKEQTIFEAGTQYGGNNLKNHIYTTKDNTTNKIQGKIIAGKGFSNEAMHYIEFGTGIVGKEKQHEWANETDYKYDVNSHGKNGWWYPVYSSDSDKPYAWTRGMKPNRFVYKTKKKLRAIALSTLMKYYSSIK